MSYLLNYKNWKSLHEAIRINESAFANLDLTKLKVDDEYKKAAISDDQSLYNALLQFFKNNGIIFSVDQATAAAICVKDGNFREPIKYNNTNNIDLKPGAEDNNKVLTTGLFFEDNIQDPDDASMESEYLNIAKYLNNATLLGIKDQDHGYGYGAKVTTNGSLQAFEAPDQYRYLYGTSKTNIAQSKSEVKTTTWTVPEQGKTIVKNLPGTMFATGAITLADSTELDKAVAELNDLIKDKNTKITAISIESSSSGDRGVKGVSGYPTGTKAGTYKLGTPYLPKSAAESENAKLAFGRGETIKAKLGNLAPVTVKAMIQDGGDAAQYAKIIVNVEKVDKPAQALTKQELQGILTKPKSTEDLGAIKRLVYFRFNF
jgi:hypothetical protein